MPYDPPRIGIPEFTNYYPYIPLNIQPFTNVLAAQEGRLRLEDLAQQLRAKKLLGQAFQKLGTQPTYQDFVKTAMPYAPYLPQTSIDDLARLWQTGEAQQTQLSLREEATRLQKQRIKDAMTMAILRNPEIAETISPHFAEYFSPEELKAMSEKAVEIQNRKMQAKNAEQAAVQAFQRGDVKTGQFYWNLKTELEKARTLPWSMAKQYWTDETGNIYEYFAPFNRQTGTVGPIPSANIPDNVFPEDKIPPSVNIPDNVFPGGKEPPAGTPSILTATEPETIPSPTQPGAMEIKPNLPAQAGPWKKVPAKKPNDILEAWGKTELGRMAIAKAKEENRPLDEANLYAASKVVEQERALAKKSALFARPLDQTAIKNIALMKGSIELYSELEKSVLFSKEGEKFTGPLDDFLTRINRPEERQALHTKFAALQTNDQMVVRGAHLSPGEERIQSELGANIDIMGKKTVKELRETIKEGKRQMIRRYNNYVKALNMTARDLKMLSETGEEEGDGSFTQPPTSIASQTITPQSLDEIWNSIPAR